MLDRIRQYIEDYKERIRSRPVEYEAAELYDNAQLDLLKDLEELIDKLEDYECDT